jgi:AraC-like DNA-binding protein
MQPAVTAKRPKEMTDRPQVEGFTNPLSEVLGSIRIEKAECTRLEATSPWGFRSSGLKGKRVLFVFVVAGSAFLKFEGKPEATALSGGDLLIMFDDQPFSMADHSCSRIVDSSEVRKQRVNGVVRYGGGGPITTLMFGKFSMNTLEALPIRSILPQPLYVSLSQDRSHAFQSVLDLLAAETAQPGMASSFMISRLYESLLVYAIRAYASSAAAPQSGWLAAISDNHLSRAIQAMYSGIRKNWSVESLAREARMSRSAFASRFKRVLGQTPLAYLTRWRLHKAGAMIRSSNTSLFEVAKAVGYESEDSLSRAFKRELGVSPNGYRRMHAQETELSGCGESWEGHNTAVRNS